MVNIPYLLYRAWKMLIKNIDFPLFLITFAIMGVGLATVYSATFDSDHRMLSQAINMGVALLVMWTIAKIPPNKLMNYSIILYIGGLILLIGVFLFGITVNGAKRWLSIGFTRIQPSEILKIAMPMMLAWYFQKVDANLRWWHFIVASLLLAVPFLLIAKQPDLGTAILVGASGFFVIFFAGLPWKVIFTLIALGAISAPLLWNMLHDYQRQRILTLLDPASDPLGAGYHIIQSTIAIGSGGLSGKGFLNGTQTHLEFIPEKHTDFIFAVFSEEWGFIGNLVLLFLYFLLISRGIMIAIAAQTLFSRLLASAITMGFFTYAFINMGMVSGILPVVGVPLPFMSYGGTALIILFVGIGILMSIQTHHSRRV